MIPIPVERISRLPPRAKAQRDERYDAATIWLHWSTVALVAILWPLGQVTGWVPRVPFRSGLWSTHVALGLLLAVVLVTRILWRASFGSALPPADARALNWLAKCTHHGLYVSLLRSSFWASPMRRIAPTTCTDCLRYRSSGVVTLQPRAASIRGMNGLPTSSSWLPFSTRQRHSAISTSGETISWRGWAREETAGLRVTGRPTNRPALRA